MPEETKLDNPLYGDFEDYLDGVLSEARRQEVEALLARSAAARALLEELQTARSWLWETRWDIPEPGRWPSAEAILARAGWRPPGWWRRQSITSRRPVWAVGAAAGLVLLVGGSLWWMLAPPSPNDVAPLKTSSRLPETIAELPTRASSPDAPAASPAAEHASPKRAQNDPALKTDTTGNRRPDAAPPVPVDIPSPAPTRPPTYSPMFSGQGEPPPPTDTAEPGRRHVNRGASSSPAMSGRQPESPEEAQPAVPTEAVVASTASNAQKRAVAPADLTPASTAETASPSSPVTLQCVVADRRQAVRQATAIAQACGGTAQLDGNRLVVTVPVVRIDECVVRLRARLPVARDGQRLQITVRAPE